MVSLQRELFSLPLSLLSSPCCLIYFRLRRAIPPARKLFSLSPLPRPPQAPSSSPDRCPALSRMSSVALVSSVDVSSSRSDRKSGAPSLSFEYDSPLPTLVRSVHPPATIPSRAYTIGIFFVAPPIRPLLSSFSGWTRSGTLARPLSPRG